MRKISLLILLATTAAPAIAQDHDRGGRQRGNDSTEQTENTHQRGSGNHQREAPAEAVQPTRSAGGNQATGGNQAGADNHAAFEAIREHRQQRVETATTQIQPNDGGGDHRGNGGGDHGTSEGRTTNNPSPTNWRERERHVRTIPDTQPASRRPTEGEHGGLQTPNRRDYRDGDYRRWTNNWHNDRRYDWNRYRNQHRSIFRLGVYYDPFGYNYRRWSIGSFLYPSYYGSSFWLNDPWQYRLPPAYGPYRWVRYWNDALLVNVYTGQVVEVMHGFFW